MLERKKLYVIVSAVVVRDCLQISLLILSELKRINYLLFPLKSSENHRFFDDFSENRN